MKAAKLPSLPAGSPDGAVAKLAFEAPVGARLAPLEDAANPKTSRPRLKRTVAPEHVVSSHTLAAPAILAPMAASRKADLRQVAIRWYAGLRFHARNCTDCTPGATDADPPRINRLCWPGKAIKADYERAYRAWVDCPEGKGL